jgi:hypothetical protein
LEKLREMRANSESYGGQTERGLRNFIYTSNEIDRIDGRKAPGGAQDIIEHNRKFNRRHFNEFYNLVERHDMRPNKPNAAVAQTESADVVSRGSWLTKTTSSSSFPSYPKP